MSSARGALAFLVVVIAAVVSQTGLGQARESRADESSASLFSSQLPRFRRATLIGSSPMGRHLAGELKARAEAAASSSSSLPLQRPARSLRAPGAAPVSREQSSLLQNPDDFQSPAGSDARGSVLRRILRSASSHHGRGQGQQLGVEGRRSRRSLRAWSMHALTPYAAKQPPYSLPALVSRPWSWQGTSWGRGFYPPANPSSSVGRGGRGETTGGYGPAGSEDVGVSTWGASSYPQPPAPGSSRRFMAWGRNGSFMLG